mgnify:CR=1 FL=1
MVTSPKISECTVLLRELGYVNKPPCVTCTSNSFYSWRKEEKGMGCWVAHTALTCLECLRLMPRMFKPIEKYNLTWEDVEVLAVMHDVGKLSSQYLEGKKIQHNVISSYIMLELCKDDETIENSKPVALAILLHHEAYHWKRLLHLQIQPFHFVDSIKTINEDIRLGDGYRLALDNLSDFLKKMKIKAGLKLINRLKERNVYHYDQREINRLLAENAIRAKAFLLYWILYLADNRAASSRESHQNYWIEPLRRMSPMSPSDLAQKILENHPRPDISLTAIPVKALTQL